MSENKFSDTMWEEIGDNYVKDVLLEYFVDQLQESHTVTQIEYVPQLNKWLVKLERDLFKSG